MLISGVDVASMARSDQSSYGYQPDDSWVNILLVRGRRLWRGVGGPYSPYHLGTDNNVGGLATDFWQSCQVKISPTYGPRMEVAEYEVLDSVPAAHGLCSDNWYTPDGEVFLGWGGAVQFFIPRQYENHLSCTGNRVKLR